MTRARAWIVNHTVGPSAFWRTLRFRFAFWVGALLLLAQAALAAFVYARLEDRLSNNVDDTLRLNAAQIRAMVEAQEGELALPDEDVNDSLSADLQEQSLTARILSPSGEIIQAYGIYRDLPINTSILDAVHQQQEKLVTTTEPDDADDKLRVLAVPILQDGELAGIVEVTQTMDSVEDTLEQLLIIFQIGMPISVIIAALGGYGLAARVLARVDSITDMAQRISAEDLSARLDFPPINDEVGRLAQTFDMMLGRLEESFQRERQFTSDASHELRTPLAAMRTILDMTRAKRRSVEDYEQALDDLAGEMDRLQGLVSDLLRLARNESPETATHETVDLSALLVDIADSLRPLAERKHLGLDHTLPEGLTLNGDRDQLIRLFVNLLENAVKFTDQGAITISGAAASAGFVTITIADTGQGIAPEHLPHVFERFYRAEASRTTAGAGLGLTIALSIARAHGGTIEVESEVGQGTRFRVLLRTDLRANLT
ncbi:MAG: HAMP domain-containing protein [Chloroflexi bacterium]|nr:HAMP domain-containing protein [Chloroflexota bacterium]